MGGDYAVHVSDNKLGKILKIARKDADVSVVELASKIGVSKRYLYEIEAGKKKPSFDVLYSLVRELYIIPDLIFYPEKSTKQTRIENLVRMLSVCDDNELALVMATVKALVEK